MPCWCCSLCASCSHSCGLRYSKNPASFELDVARTTLPAAEANVAIARITEASLSESAPNAVGKATKHLGRKVMDEVRHDLLFMHLSC